MSRVALTLFAALTLSACGGSDPYEVPSGEYEVAEVMNPSDGFPAVAAFEGVVVSIDVAGLALTVTAPDGGRVVYGLALAPEELWAEDCYTNISHAVTLAYTLDEDTLALGPATLDRPMLSAKCGGAPLLYSGSDPDLDWGADVVYLQELDANLPD
ncbi:MAG: hypothetical protein JXX28_19325 [Deltaproteobacteria bacterium]|nr:hypothetical protein [Deltaproteobacteria bacterium]